MSMHQHNPTLSLADQAALDALLEAGLDPAKVKTSHSERAGHLAGQLSILDHAPAPKPSDNLAARTLQRIAAHSATAQTATLCQADQDALDALVDVGFDVSKVPAAHAARAGRIAGLMSALDRLPAPSTGDLLAARTLAAAKELRRRELSESLGAQGAGIMSSGFRWPELITVAAMLLIGISVAWPYLAQSSQRARMIACQNNLRTASGGLAAYAATFHGAMPRMMVRAGDPWWYTGQDHSLSGPVKSNSAHAYVLIRENFVAPETLCCVANPNVPREVSSDAIDWANYNAVSYSYQNQYGQADLRWAQGPVIAVLADKNPYFQGPQFVRTLPQNATSSNHTVMGGQNVLFSDGTVRWMRSQVLENGDNIYHAGRGRTEYKGNETPETPADSFLVP